MKRGIQAQSEPLRDRILRQLYAPQPPQIAQDIYGEAAPERQAMLLARLFRYEAVPPQRSKNGMVE